MRKLLVLIGLVLVITAPAFALWNPTQSEMYVVTLNTTTYTEIITRNANTIYNPGAYDIKLASASTASTTNRFTIKAATYLENITINSRLYGLATDTNSVTIEIWTGK